MEPCDVGSNCRLSPAHAGLHARCESCSLSPDNVAEWQDNKDNTVNNIGANYWRPIDKRIKHPVLLQLIKDVKYKRALDKIQAKRIRNVKKVKTARIARLAEKATEKNIIKATKNSGRSHKDGDHIMSNGITLDTKHQDKANPTVLLTQLDKVREDAKRAGSEIGALVLRNNKGVGVVVLAETDFALLVRKIINGAEAKS